MGLFEDGFVTHPPGWVGTKTTIAPHEEWPWDIYARGSITHTTTGVYTQSCVGVSVHSPMKEVQECAEKAGKKVGDEHFLSSALGVT